MSEVLRPVVRPRAGVLWQAWFGMAGAPLAWFAQLTIGYGLWSYRCYPGDAPIVWRVYSGASTPLAVVDLLAIAIALAGFIVSWRIRRNTLQNQADLAEPAALIGAARTRFLSDWGMLSSGCFLLAILFATIVSLGVPSCG